MYLTKIFFFFTDFNYYTSWHQNPNVNNYHLEHLSTVMPPNSLPVVQTSINLFKNNNNNNRKIEKMDINIPRHYCKCGKSYKFFRHLNYHKKWECEKNLMCNLCEHISKSKRALEHHFKKHLPQQNKQKPQLQGPYNPSPSEQQ